MRWVRYDLPMRLVLAVAVGLALVACSKGKSKLDDERSAAVDALWDMAPDQTELGVVVSPRAVDLGFRAIAAARKALDKPDFDMVRPQLDALTKSMFGSETGSPEDAGYAHDKAFAMFVTSDGVVGVMPVGNRDKFMAAKHGERGSGEDKIESNTCRQIGAHYVCATEVKLFDRVGKGKLRGATKAAGARGDVEVYMTGLPLLGESKGELALAAQVEPGQVSVFGAWTGTVDEPVAKLVGVTAPKPDTSGASGFVATNLAPLLAFAPDVPIAGGVSLQQLAKSAAGPIMSVVPAGDVDIQFSIALTDPKPAQTIIDNCKEVGALFKLAEKQTPGACRVVLQGTSAVEVDIWVEGNTLRLGAKKGPKPAGKPGAVTAVGRELAAGTWTLVAWGRGTTLNLGGVTPAKEDVPKPVAFSVHLMSLVNELGFAARVDKDAVRFRGLIRTTWTNPPDVTDKAIAVSGTDILNGKGTEAAKAIAAAAPTSPFAADFAAGQGGLMLPLAMTSLSAGLVLGPTLMRLFGDGGGGGGGGEESPTGGPPMSQTDLVTLLLHAYSDEALPQWRAAHPDKKCPQTLDELATLLGASDPSLPVKTDPWGHDLVFKCDDKTFTITSLGPDGKADTADDIRVSSP
jgi:hypothetical protein